MNLVLARCEFPLIRPNLTLSPGPTSSLIRFSNGQTCKIKTRDCENSKGKDYETHSKNFKEYLSLMLYLGHVTNPRN